MGFCCGKLSSCPTDPLCPAGTVRTLLYQNLNRKIQPYGATVRHYSP